ncbi:16S rRNA (guanine527-N7)-methyltransferase [Sphingomonas naasensis]|uniref:Ribosomal RNA small subunit methyltransferase G n=1 Tax=Sphingomonas naasensis TaxID=1344951 RepID=A0A4S1W798_9SPHN|nr:16S rRNA (guanine(527)-N(7))-methyltransferase RsmG [Sphingomonas naasensis]NIJ21297.1 16S rRNA (guanine527-N7)-methyltransferase [Sphingomonas naasensis]TGX38731.1 16S rRNA (guanine(527)-N(7))-methyltransferase RsmG [Sphingomonas naasensis]
MSEEEAREWVRSRFGVSRETLLDRYAALLRAESEHQNLIARSTLDEIWSRHFVDSAQLVPLADAAAPGAWLDVGSGAGLPGIVAAILTERLIVLAEPRARRVTFLRSVAEALGLAGRVTVHAGKVESFAPVAPVAIVSARAVAELSQLLASTVHSTDLSTIWVLPKGRDAQSEVADARRAWQGVFHVEPSLTQLDSGIVVARGVRRK